MNLCRKWDKIVASVAFLCLLVPIFPIEAQEPTLEVRLDRPTARVNDPFQVVYEASWSGPPDAFAFEPGEVEEVPWGKARLVQTATGMQNGRYFVAQVVEFVPSDAGHYQVPPFVIGYFDPAQVEAGESAPAQSFLRAEALAITIRPRLRPYLMYGSLAVLVLCLAAGGALMYRRSRPAALGAVGDFVPDTVQAALHLARQYRLDGRFYEFYRELVRGVEFLAPSVAARKLREKLESDAERVGYKGIRPTDDEMDGALKDVERVVKAAPDDDT